MTKKKDIAKKIMPFIIAASGITFIFTTITLKNAETTHQGQVVEVMAAPASFGTNVLQQEEENPDVEIIGEKIAIYPEYDFVRKEQTAYLIKDSKLRQEPYEDSSETAGLKKYDKIILTGTNNLTYWEASYKGKKCYIDNSTLTTDKSVITKMKEKEKQERIAKQKAKAAREAAKKAKKSAIHYPKWNGSRLTKSGGVNAGPSGKETYYNLPMQGVVKIMRQMGNKDEYWVREDGCKMLGKYIMVAANLKIRPRGSLVKTSLGMGIVCDTGTFAKENPYQLDIAVSW